MRVRGRQSRRPINKGHRHRRGEKLRFSIKLIPLGTRRPLTEMLLFLALLDTIAGTGGSGPQRAHPTTSAPTEKSERPRQHDRLVPHAPHQRAALGDSLGHGTCSSVPSSDLVMTSRRSGSHCRDSGNRTTLWKRNSLCCSGPGCSSLRRYHSGTRSFFLNPTTLSLLTVASARQLDEHLAGEHF